MPAIPIFKSSPINARKPDGTTPATAAPPESGATGSRPAHNAAHAPTSPEPASTSYPPAQPEARPPVAAPTGAVSPPTQAAAAPTLPATKTSAYESTRTIADPPPPRPGPVPVPVPVSSPYYRAAAAGGASPYAVPPPPPPKADEMPLAPGRAGHLAPLPTAEPASAPAAWVHVPPQVGIPPPNPPHTSDRGTSSSLPHPGHGHVGITADGEDHLSHPPGYRQDVGATEFSSHQRAAASAYNAGRVSSSRDDGEGEGLWDTAKKWAKSTGESLAAAESEVWKRINKE